MLYNTSNIPEIIRMHVQIRLGDIEVAPLPKPREDNFVLAAFCAEVGTNMWKKFFKLEFILLTSSFWVRCSTSSATVAVDVYVCVVSFETVCEM